MHTLRYNVFARNNFLRWRPPVSDNATQAIFEVTLPAPELSKGEREYRAFLRLLPELLPNYRGRHVAIHEGAVIDSDVNDIALIHRVHDRIGYVPIHVGLVTDRPAVVRIPHYREYGRGKMPDQQCPISPIGPISRIGLMGPMGLMGQIEKLP